VEVDGELAGDMELGEESDEVVDADHGGEKGKELGEVNGGDQDEGDGEVLSLLDSVPL